MAEDNRQCGCGCGTGFFGGNGILFFIIVFLLLFWNGFGFFGPGVV